VYRELPTFFPVTTSDLILFSRQLSTFIRVGVPITDAIKLLHDASGSGAFRFALADICEDLEAGEAFSTAIAHHPQVFNQLYVDMVRAAEYSGTLEPVLTQVATHLQRQDSAIKKLRSAMIYPAVILVLAVAVCTVLIVFVLPNFVAIFKEFHAKLPLPTRMLLAVTDFLTTWWWALLGGLLAVIFGTMAALAGPTERGRSLPQRSPPRSPRLRRRRARTPSRFRSGRAAGLR